MNVFSSSLIDACIGYDMIMLLVVCDYTSFLAYSDENDPLEQKKILTARGQL
jgi:hypothetical protein